MAQQNPLRIVILGGGFSGIYTALELEKLYRKNSAVSVTLINDENYLLFTPMLHEIAASDLEPSAIVNPIHKLLRSTSFFCGKVDLIDIDRKQVTVSHGESHHTHVLDYDHLVVALGSVTNFFGLPGLADNALTMKTLGDAIHLRNRMIGFLEEADFECCKDIRGRLLTFVVAGGGFAGVETVAAMQDFLHSAKGFYGNLKHDDIRVILVNSGDRVLPELDRKLGEYTGKVLKKRGVEIFYNTRVKSYKNSWVELSNGERIESCTLVWAAGTAPNPLLEQLACTKEKGRILVTEELYSKDHPSLWSLGDCAAVPDSHTGGFHPPTAQHATRQAKTLARNIYAIESGASAKPFRFKTLGQLASLGRRSGVAQIMGLRFSGFIAWWLWRGIYLMKLPRIDRRIRVAIDWTLDIFFSKDIVQLPTIRGSYSEVPRRTSNPVVSLNGAPPEHLHVASLSNT